MKSQVNILGQGKIPTLCLWNKQRWQTSFAIKKQNKRGKYYVKQKDNNNSARQRTTVQ